MGTMREEINFYMNDAEPELLEERREYIEVALMNRLEKGLLEMHQWDTAFANKPESAALMSVYHAGLDFFIKAGFRRREINNG